MSDELPRIQHPRGDMAELEPGQAETRAHFESLITTVSPFLDLVLAVGDRISRIAEPTDFEYYPIRDEEPDSGETASR